MHKFLLLATAGLLAALQASALDVYAYTLGSERTIGNVGSMQRIELNANSVKMVSTTGAEKSVGLNACDYILFRNKSIHVGVSDIAAEPADHVNIVWHADQLIVSALQQLTSVSIYNMQGRVVKTVSPRADKAVISLDECLPGIYIVRAATGAAQSTAKILKR